MGWSFLVLVSTLAVLCAAQNVKQNVLLIVVDDWRVEAGTYGSQDVRTPNIDAFAAEGVQFNNAFVAIPKCGPSRVAILSSRMPITSNYYYHMNDKTELQAFKKAVTLPTWFEANGYDTYGTSKLFHFKKANQKFFRNYKWQPIHKYGRCRLEENIVCPTATIEENTDYDATMYAIKVLENTPPMSGIGSRLLSDDEPLLSMNGRLLGRRRRRKNDGPRPFFLAVGYRRPHIKWEYPEIMQQGAPTASKPRHTSISDKMPEVARRSICREVKRSTELTGAGSLYGEGSEVIEEPTTQVLRNGYFRAVEWIDYLVGILLNKLEESGHANNTLVMIVSDHGFNLGENGQWCKMSLQDQVLRVPLLVRDPQAPTQAGVKVNHQVSITDLFPTIADLAGIPMDKNTVNRYNVDGRSFAHLMKPDEPISEITRDVMEQAVLVGGFEHSFPLNGASFSLVQRCQVPGCEETPQTGFQHVGYSVRTGKYRYTEWRPWIKKNGIADWITEPAAKELYDFDVDPDQVNNVADSSANDAIMETLSKYLRANFLPCHRNTKSKAETNAKACALKGDHCQMFGKFCHYKSACFMYKSEQACSATFCKWTNEKKCHVDLTKVDTTARFN